jgi:hypothetical protein
MVYCELYLQFSFVRRAQSQNTSYKRPQGSLSLRIISIPEDSSARMIRSQGSRGLQRPGTRVIQAEATVILAVRPTPVRLKVLDEGEKISVRILVP